MVQVIYQSQRSSNRAIRVKNQPVIWNNLLIIKIMIGCQSIHNVNYNSICVSFSLVQVQIWRHAVHTNCKPLTTKWRKSFVALPTNLKQTSLNIYVQNCSDDYSFMIYSCLSTSMLLIDCPKVHSSLALLKISTLKGAADPLQAKLMSTWSFFSSKRTRGWWYLWATGAGYWEELFKAGLSQLLSIRIIWRW